MNRIIIALLPVAAILGLAGVGAAQTEAPLDVENELYAFSFTVEQDSIVTYRDGGTGFTSIHNPTGGGAGSEPDYGLVVFGRESYGLSEREAMAVGLGDKTVLLGRDDVDSQDALNKLVKAQMAVHEREPAGTAQITAPDGVTIEAPYFIWQRTVGGKTHHALMYVARHETGFILVQVESSRPLPPERLAWMTSRLQLLEPPAEEPAG